ncbi:riboflavin transporter MCH5 [Colletotrichum scovillei]|uniref:Riboflavin transporter MCH5 n=1 Tax=Colletotrichum scovillei TaxID=1209932 RepID=A0A9P7RJ02_9PEZI|nr:riboflavin transporter MCH5 [Colletotrichum scovillei]KAF4777970.1 riboflavin transporter MCH5 [Colletotrichum scovillei]KAG7059271.1 riboflavin transporter MCH5 [Colletotrichum scovillei]KAG7077911.1 riboflavin transporter MCH5 [Colletotrichum scovillei]KAG7085012.1 riboflavin transporter MCH5 [Colletotrichum scovillei]
MEERLENNQEKSAEKQAGPSPAMPRRSSNDHATIEAFPGDTQPTLQSPKTASDTIDDELHDDEIEYPDGGFQAWMVVVGAWCAMIPPMGLINTISVLQGWLLQNELRGVPESKAGWIFSCYAFFITACGAQIGPVFDAFDIRVLLIPGSIGMIASMIFLSLSTEFYQMLLSFGICGGISAAFLFNPALSAIGHWFNERRAFATGVACTAGGLGGIGFSLIIQYLAPRIGFPWAMRIIAFISTGSLVVTNIFLRKRLPPKRKAKALIDFRLLRGSRFGVTVVAVFFVEFAVFIPYSYISSYAIEKGLGLQKSFLLNVLLNAGAIPGRMLPGYIADRVGAFNTMCVTSLCCGVLILGLWLAAGDVDAKIMSFTTLFGFWSGAAISLSPVCISRVCKIEDYGKSTGMAYFIASFGALVGIPLAGFLLKTGTEPYRNLIIFAGAAYMVAFVAFCGARGIAGGWKPALF